MDLKATLKDYTAPEFQALVDRIWAVDLPKQDHDRLINHFDQIVGHPKGADLLFYSDDRFISNSAELVMYHVRNWHHKLGIAAFKGEPVSVPRPPAPMSPVARNLAEVQKIAADVAVSEQAVEMAFGVFGQGIRHLSSLQGLHLGVSDQEKNLCALELAQYEAMRAIGKFEFFKMRIEFAKNSAQSNLTYARSEHGLWQSIAQQINATYGRYIAQSANMTQRHRALHDDAETLLIAAQEQLIRSRNVTGVGPVYTACVVTASLNNIDKLPAVLLTDEPSALLTIQQKDLRKSIRSAVGEFTWQNTSGEPVDGNERAAVLQFEFSSRADIQVYGLSVPLAELVAIEGQHWQNLAANRAEVDVPFRMNSAIVTAKPGMLKGLREVKSLSQVYVTPCKGRDPASRVRVRAALQGEHQNSFSFIADGVAPITVSWSAPAPHAASASMEGTLPNRLGFVHSLPVPLLEPLMDKENLSFDDYIVVFPVESGLDPLYVMFRNRREYPV